MAPSVFDASVGAFLVGTFLAVFLGGITTTQAFTYYVNFHRTDKLIYKFIVYGLLCIDSFHTITICHTVYKMLVTHYGDVASLAQCEWSFAIEPAFTGLVALVAQSFFAYRVYVVSGRKWFISGTILVLSFVSFGFSVGGTVMIYQLDMRFSRFHEWQWGVTIWLLCAAVADLIITASLVYYLKKATAGEYQRSTMLVNRILANTVETNGLTLAVAVADTIAFLVAPSLGWHVIPQFLLVKLYHTSVLVSLNSRKTIASLQNSYASESYSYKQSPVVAYSTTVPRRPTTSGTVDSETSTKKIIPVELHRHTMVRTHSREDHPFAQTASGDSAAQDIELAGVPQVRQVADPSWK